MQILGKKQTIGEVKKEGFKINWKSFKKAYNTCELEGKESHSCKKVLEDLGIDVIDNE
jgi:hypothetical protein